MGIWSTVPEMGPTIAMGSAKAHGSKAKPIGGSERGTKRHKGWPTFWHTRGPIEGTRRPQASYLSLDQDVSFMPLCGLAYSRPGFLHGLPRKEA
jgi:hypothetical protein